MEDWSKKIGRWVDRSPSVQIVSVTNVLSILLTFLVIMIFPISEQYALETMVGIYLMSGTFVLMTLFGLRKDALGQKNEKEEE